MPRTLLCTAIVAGLSLLCNVHAQSIDNADMEYYSISGETAEELRDALNADGPLDDGETYDAHTGWKVQWRWPGYGKEDCDLEEASTSYDLTVIFPQWEDAEDADSDVQEQWQEYLNALAEHEQGHADIFLERYPEILQAIQDSDCSNAEDAANEVLASIQEESKAYDEETGHGATQGATFP